MQDAILQSIRKIGVVRDSTGKERKTVRNPKRIPIFLKALGKFWLLEPDMRFPRLVNCMSNCCRAGYMGSTLFYIEDNVVLKGLKKMRKHAIKFQHKEKNGQQQQPGTGGNNKAAVDAKRIPAFLKELEGLWLAAPDLRFGQLDNWISVIVRSPHSYMEDHMEDDAILNGIRKMRKHANRKNHQSTKPHYPQMTQMDTDSNH